MSPEIEAAFLAELLNTCVEAKKIGYNPTKFKRMILCDGAFETAHKLLASKTPQEGLGRLWELGRLDLSMEVDVLREPWCQYFSQAELAEAHKRLNQRGFQIALPVVTAIEPALCGRQQIETAAAPVANARRVAEAIPRSMARSPRFSLSASSVRDR